MRARQINRGPTVTGHLAVGGSLGGHSGRILGEGIRKHWTTSLAVGLWSLISAAFISISSAAGLWPSDTTTTLTSLGLSCSVHTGCPFAVCTLGLPKLVKQFPAPTCLVLGQRRKGVQNWFSSPAWENCDFLSGNRSYPWKTQGLWCGGASLLSLQAALMM